MFDKLRKEVLKAAVKEVTKRPMKTTNIPTSDKMFGSPHRREETLLYRR